MLFIHLGYTFVSFLDHFSGEPLKKKTVKLVKLCYNEISCVNSPMLIVAGFIQS